MIARDARRETLLTLYGIFKEEVYRRRDRMMGWTATGAGSLFTLLLIILLVPSARQITTPSRLLLASGSLLLALTFAMLIGQQYDRHRQAKQQLIKLEHALALFEDRHGPDDRPIYPEDWQTAWSRDRSLAQYLAILAFLTAIILAAIILPVQ